MTSLHSKRRRCRIGVTTDLGVYVPEVYAVTISEGGRSRVEYIIPQRLRSGRLNRVRTVFGERKLINTSFVVEVERMTVIANRQDISDWDCYKDRGCSVYKQIYYVVPFGWSWDDFDSRIDSTEAARHILKTELFFGD